MNNRLEFFDIVSNSNLRNTKNRFDLWKIILENSNVKNFAEIGVWKGDFAAFILKKISSIENYFMVDPWANLPDWNKPSNVNTEKFNLIYEEALQNTSFASSKIHILRGRTKEVIDKIPNDFLDFAYIDGDHTLRGITIDLIKLCPKVKVGGFIAGDDFTTNPWQHSKSFDPTLVCPLSVYFAEAMNFPFLALPHNQFLMQKNVTNGFTFTEL